MAETSVFKTFREFCKANFENNILQANRNRIKLAHGLLTQLCAEKIFDIALINEQHLDSAGVGRVTDELGIAAIWVVDTRNTHFARRQQVRLRVSLG